MQDLLNKIDRLLKEKKFFEVKECRRPCGVV